MTENTGEAYKRTKEERHKDIAQKVIPNINLSKDFFYTFHFRQGAYTEKKKRCCIKICQQRRNCRKFVLFNSNVIETLTQLFQ